MRQFIPLLIFVFIILSCEEIDNSEQSTWNIIKNKILATSCGNCHVTGSAMTKQSGLDLSQNDSYSRLVGVTPKNIAAKNDGLVIVSNAGGMKGLSKSYLWEKININNEVHFYSEHPLYGEIMPLGGPYLTNGELDFIEDWIWAGAPESGIVADITTSAFEIAEDRVEELVILISESIIPRSSNDLSRKLLLECSTAPTISKLSTLSWMIDLPSLPQAPTIQSLIRFIIQPSYVFIRV